MERLTFLKILRCFLIAVSSLILFFLVLIGTITAFEIAPSLEAPFQFIFQPEKLGRQIGEITVSWNGKNKPFKVYTGKRHYLYKFRSFKIGKCLLLYPKYSLWFFPFEHAFKVTENTIEIFDDAPFSCLPMGSYIYESDRAVSGHPISDDMSGWDAKFSISSTPTAVNYKIAPSKYSGSGIYFSIPQEYFNNLRNGE